MLSQRQAFSKSHAEEIYQLVYMNRRRLTYSDYEANVRDFNKYYDNDDDFLDTVTYCLTVINDTDYYNDLVQVSDSPTYSYFDKITKMLNDQEINDYNCAVQMYKDHYVRAFGAKTGYTVSFEGRSGKHVCVENTLKTATKLKEFQIIWEGFESQFIEDVNKFIKRICT